MTRGRAPTPENRPRRSWASSRRRARPASDNRRRVPCLRQAVPKEPRGSSGRGVWHGASPHRPFDPDAPARLRMCLRSSAPETARSLEIPDTRLCGFGDGVKSFGANRRLRKWGVRRARRCSRSARTRSTRVGPVEGVDGASGPGQAKTHPSRAAHCTFARVQVVQAVEIGLGGLGTDRLVRRSCRTTGGLKAQVHGRPAMALSYRTTPAARKSASVPAPCGAAEPPTTPASSAAGPV